MKTPQLLALLALCAAPAPTAAHAETPPPLPLTYETFEAAVPHIDLEFCPEPLDGPDRFCRATLVHDQINVFAFATAGDSPLVAQQSWPAALLNGLLD